MIVITTGTCGRFQSVERSSESVDAMESRKEPVFKISDC